MKRYMEQHTTGNSFVAVLCGSVGAIANNHFEFQLLFIHDIQQDAIKAVIVGFLGAMAGLIAKSVHAYAIAKIKAVINKPK